MIESLLDSLDLDPLLEHVSSVGWVQELVLIGIFAGVAVVVDFLLTRLLRSLVARSNTDLDDRFVKLLHRPVLSTIVSLGLWIVIVRAHLAAAVQTNVGRILFTVLLIVWANFLIRAFLLVLEGFSRLQRRKKIIDPRMLPLTSMITRVVVIGAAIYFLLAIWGLNVTPLLGTAGVIGLVLGLAARDTLGNLFSGIAIMADTPYERGDYIVLDSGERGEVTRVGLRSTRLLTRDDIEIVIPNSVMADAAIVNQSGPAAPFRIRADIQVAYGTDVDRLNEVLMDIAAKEPLLEERPEPRVRMRGFGDSGIDFQLMGWVERPAASGRALHSIYTTVYKRLEQEGIEIPFPTRKVYLPQNDNDDAG